MHCSCVLWLGGGGSCVVLGDLFMVAMRVYMQVLKGMPV